ERRRRLAIHARAAPERADPDEREEIDHRARNEPERAIEEEPGHSDLRRVIQDLLLVADEEVTRARDEPSEETPVEIAEQQNEHGERQCSPDETPEEVAARPESDVREKEAEPHDDEPRASGEPWKGPDERARKGEAPDRRRGAVPDEAHRAHEHHSL